MELLQMKYFTAIVENKSMTKAAELLHISQSTLSCSMGKLEDEFNVNLFQKSGRYLELTKAGKFFYEEISDILHKCEKLQKQLKSFDTSQNQNVTVITDVVDFAQQSTALFLQLYPNITLNYHRNMFYMDNQQKFLHKKADFLLTTIPPTVDSKIECHLLLEEPIIAILPIDHPLSKNKLLSLHELKSESLITLPVGTSNREIHSQICKIYKLPTNKVYEMNDPESCSLAVVQGCGYALIPQCVRNFQLRPGSPFYNLKLTSLPLIESNCKRRIYLCWHKDDIHQSSTSTYITFMKKFSDYVKTHSDFPESINFFKG